jgi:protein tyrosine phosphatase (PTP) superfamily phosphohydrolase (DUF442 family)
MIEDLKNFLRLSDKLISSGMPSADQLKSVAESGVQVVINLAPSTANDALHGEEKIVTDLGMKYINIPVVWGEPTRENLEEFMTAMGSHTDSGILVHCQANYRATGFIALYRINRLGWAQENAFKDVQKIWDPAEYPIWQEFIEKSLRAQS